MNDSPPPAPTNESPAAPKSPAVKPLSRRAMWLLIGFASSGALVGVVLVILILPRWLHTPEDASSQPGSSAQGETRKINATLFYVSDDGSELVPVSREVSYGATPGEQARRIIEAQLQAPPKGQISAIPPGIKVRALFITARGEAFVDLSREIITGHTGGSLDELLAVFALVDSLTVNLPDISAVQLLVDGKEIDTLVGHLDLRHPLARSLRWVRRDSK